MNSFAQAVFAPSAPGAGKRGWTLVVAGVALGLLAHFLSRHWSHSGEMTASQAEPPAATAPARETTTERTIRFYAERVRRDRDDTRSQNVLAESYLQEVRETGNEDYLPLALGAARISLGSVPAVRNLGGLTARAHAEFANHSFAAARDDALRLAELQPDRSEPFAILGDALLELGDYEGAATAFAKMSTHAEPSSGSETRLARLAFLRGHPEEARAHLQTALRLVPPGQPNETRTWCRWQLGELAFAGGDYETAESSARAALAEAPDYFRALGSLGRVRAARGDLAGAIGFYEEAVRAAPGIDFMAALGDLYQLTGRPEEAAARYELVEQLGAHAQLIHGSPFERHLALFFADHDLKAEAAYALARGEFEAGRHDVYAADAVAWTALKSGRIAEAQAASQDALRLGTPDAKLFYHAGMVARAAGDKATAAKRLQRALTLNPRFDPLQSALARKALADL